MKEQRVMALSREADGVLELDGWLHLAVPLFAWHVLVYAALLEGSL